MGHKHARKGPSGAARWWYCGMSVIESDNYDDESSEAADEGTAAHFLAAFCLESKLNEGSQAAKPVDFKGIRIAVPDEQGYVEGDVVGFIASGEDEPMTGRVFEVDATMIDAVDTYIRQVMTYDYDEVHVEVDLDISWLTQEAGDVGTADVVGIKYLEDGTLLIGVHDLKYGKSPKGKVWAEENEQLAMYLMAARREYEWIGDVSMASMHIHQPRLNHHDVWGPATGWLDDKQKFCIEHAKAIDAGLVDYAPSEKVCYWCKHLPNCEAAQAAVDEIQVDFPVMEKVGPRGGKSAEAPQGAYLNEAYAKIGLAERWAQAVRVAAHRQIEEHPDTMPDWKMVAGKSVRSYSDQAAVADWMKRSKFKAEDYAPPQFCTPPQLEKLVGKKYYAEHIQPFVKTAPGKPGIVHISDPKPAITKFDDVDFPEMEEGLE